MPPSASATPPIHTTQRVPKRCSNDSTNSGCSPVVPGGGSDVGGDGDGTGVCAGSSATLEGALSDSCCGGAGDVEAGAATVGDGAASAGTTGADAMGGGAGASG